MAPSQPLKAKPSSQAISRFPCLSNNRVQDCKMWAWRALPADWVTLDVSHRKVKFTYGVSQVRFLARATKRNYWRNVCSNAPLLSRSIDTKSAIQVARTLPSNAANLVPTMTIAPIRTKMWQLQVLWSKISKWENTSQSPCQLRAMFTHGVWMTKASLVLTPMHPIPLSLKQSLMLRVISQKLSRRSPVASSIALCLQRITNYTRGAPINFFSSEGNYSQVSSPMRQLPSNNNKSFLSHQSKITPHLPVMLRHLTERSHSKSCAEATTIYVWVIDCQRLRIQTMTEQRICNSWMQVKIKTREVQARVQLALIAMKIARIRSKYWS